MQASKARFPLSQSLRSNLIRTTKRQAYFAPFSTIIQSERSSAPRA
ncbi:hypothetical protein ACHAWF_011008 [Thalassiosira exigua]